MNFTFGIITGGGQDQYINTCIDSIESENIPNYEIIIVGNSLVKRKNTTVVPFDEHIKQKWITKKKNIITELSRYENIVYMHDYIKLNNGWYAGQLLSGNEFFVRMDKIIDASGARFRDWCIWPHNKNFMDKEIGRNCLIPYSIRHLSKFQYISGSYWIAKKNIMKEFPMDESLVWGEGEDVSWSKQVREKYNFDMNINSTVILMKHGKNKVFSEPNQDLIIKLEQLKENQ